MTISVQRSHAQPGESCCSSRSGANRLGMLNAGTPTRGSAPSADGQQHPGQAEPQDGGDDVAMRSQPRLQVGEQLARAGEAEADPAGEEGHEGQGRDHVAERPGGEQVRQGLGVPFLHLLGRHDPLLMRHGRPVKRQQHD